MNRAALREEIPALLNAVEERMDSDENRRRLALWDDAGNPRPGAEKIPVTVSPEIQFWAHVHDISLVDFYRVPEVYVYGQLRTKVFAFDNFPDDRPIDRTIWMWLGTPFEGSFFGIPFDFLKDFEPDDRGATAYDTCREAAGSIDEVDFFHSGMMPLAHSLYEGCCELLPDNYDILFPDFIQTPLATAGHLVGLERFLLQAIDDQRERGGS